MVVVEKVEKFVIFFQSAERRLKNALIRLAKIPSKKAPHKVSSRFKYQIYNNNNYFLKLSYLLVHCA